MGIKFISPFEKAKKKKEEKKRREEELRHIRKEEERKRKEQERKKDLLIPLACLCVIVICFVVINVSDNGETKKGSSNTTPAMTQENTVTDDSSSEEVEEILPQADDLEESGAESEEKDTDIDTDPDPKEDIIIDYSVDYNANEIIAAYNKAFSENPVTREEVTSYETGAGHGTAITHNGILITIGYADGEMVYHFAITGEASEGKWGTFLSQTSGWLPIVANMGTQQSMETILNKLYDDILSTGKNWASHSFEGSTYYDLNYMTLERNATESIHTSGNNWGKEEFAYLVIYYE